MEELIAIVRKKNASKAIVSMRLEDICEESICDLEDWSVKDYYYQWHHAAKYALEQRNTSAFIFSYGQPTIKEPVQSIAIYTIIPKEETDGRKYFNWEDDELNKLGFVITEGCIHITNNAEMLGNGKAIECTEKQLDYPLPVYYFDVKQLDNFYLYLDRITQGYSAWDISLDELSAFEKSAKQKIKNNNWSGFE